VTRQFASASASVAAVKNPGAYTADVLVCSRLIYCLKSKYFRRYPSSPPRPLLAADPYDNARDINVLESETYDRGINAPFPSWQQVVKGLCVLTSSYVSPPCPRHCCDHDANLVEIENLRFVQTLCIDSSRLTIWIDIKQVSPQDLAFVSSLPTSKS